MDMKFLMKQAQKIQNDITKAQAELAKKEYKGTAGGSAVEVTMMGNNKVTAVKIDPELAKEDVEALQDMVVAATNACLEAIEKDRDAILTPITGGAKFPGAF